MDKKIVDYCTKHSSQESQLLYKIERETHLEVLQSRMLSGKLQGRFLSFISKLKQPKTILELGTYTGYSALCLAEGLPKDGKLVTIDKNIELQARVQAYFDESPYAQQIEFLLGNALDLLDGIHDSIDLVFLDADKSNYLQYLQKLEPKLNKGAIIIADNVLWSGKIVQEIDPKDTDTQALLAFNSYVHQSPLYTNILLPIRDGLMVMQKM